MEMKKAKKRIYRRLRFKFQLNELNCRVVSVNGNQIVEVPEDLKNDLEELLDHLKHFTEHIASLELDEADADKFLSKVFRMRAEFDEGLRDAADTGPDMGASVVYWPFYRASLYILSNCALLAVPLVSCTRRIRNIPVEKPDVPTFDLK
jgi:hypothetical protein